MNSFTLSLFSTPSNFVWTVPLKFIKDDFFLISEKLLKKFFFGAENRENKFIYILLKLRAELNGERLCAPISGGGISDGEDGASGVWEAAD